MNRQEMFDKMMEGWKSQGYKRSLKKIEGDDPVCRYRGDGTLKCVVGYLIDDKEYHEGMERMDASELIALTDVVALKEVSEGGDTEEFLMEMQLVHDGAHPIPNGKRMTKEINAELRGICKHYNVKFTKEQHLPELAEKS
jgi:hypothetical protein